MNLHCCLILVINKRNMPSGRSSLQGVHVLYALVIFSVVYLPSSPNHKKNQKNKTRPFSSCVSVKDFASLKLIMHKKETKYCSEKPFLRPLLPITRGFHSWNRRSDIILANFYMNILISQVSSALTFLLKHSCTEQESYFFSLIFLQKSLCCYILGLSMV